MIVRILEEGQYEVDDDAAATLAGLDGELAKALEAGDEALFSRVLGQLVDEVRTEGTRLDPTVIVPSDLALPRPGSSLEEVRDLLGSEDPPGS